MLPLLLVATWPMYQHRPDHNAVVANKAAAVSWTHNFGAKINGGLALADGVLYVESFDRRARQALGPMALD